MTSPQRGKGAGFDSSARGILVLAVVVVLGIVLLAKAAPSSSSSVATRRSSVGSTTSTTKVRRPATSAPVTKPKSGPGTAHAAAQVKVLVLNGSGGIPKIAGTNTDKIKGKGYNTLSPANASGGARPTTAVYFTPGYQPDAVAVAGVLGLPPTVASPLPLPPPAPNAAQANVIVVLGKDTPPAP